MASTLPSFTGPHARLATPDLARGGMLLLIALANVPIWFYSPWFQLPTDQMAQSGVISQVYEVLRTGLVDQRAYPLFALLFGFGLATMAPPPQAPGRRDPGGAWNRKLLRRRGWWMVLFGLVHSLLFVGDIIGLYGVTAVLLAGLIAHRRRKVMIVIAVVFVALAIYGGATMSDLGATGSDPAAGMPEGGLGALGWLMQWPLVNVLQWFFALIIGIPMTFVIPATIAGVFLADSGWLRCPARRLRTAWTVAVGGLTLGFLASLPHGLQVAEFTASAPSWATVLNTAAAPLSAAGWVAVFALFAIGAQAATEPSRVSHLLTAVGRRSMTAYLGQSVLFALAFAGLYGVGVLGHLTPALAGLLAVAVWSIMAIVCLMLDSRGLAGPPERLLRWVVRRTARSPRPIPAPAPAEAVTPAGDQVPEAHTVR